MFNGIQLHELKKKYLLVIPPIFMRMNLFMKDESFFEGLEKKKRVKTFFGNNLKK